MILRSLLASAILVAAGLAAFAWTGPGQARGVVLGAEGQPLEGARVEIRLAETGEGPPAAASDDDGAWSFRGLAPGSWSIRVEADGHKSGEGTIVVAEGISPPIEIRLRSLEEVSPITSEGNPQTVRKWLETGNSFLAQGEPARARPEYEKALDALPASEHVPVLLLVARTWYLEGEVARSVETLEEALRLDPADSEAREIYRLVQDQRQASDAAEAFLGSLPDEAPPRAEAGPSTTPTENFPPEAHAQLALPLEDPSPGRTGTYRVSFRVPSSLSDMATFHDRTGYDEDLVARLDDDGGAYSPAEETYQVHVPESYRPDEGWGLFVWVSPQSFGGTAWDEMPRLLAERKLIWIGANDAGNERPAWDRYHLALDAAHHVQELYDLDPERIYVGGYSGGGRVAGGLSLHYPEVFHGGLWYMGCSWYAALPIPDKPGHRWRPGFDRPTRSRLKTDRTRNRYVLVTGSRDFNRSECREVAEAMERAGFRNVTFLDVPDLDHYTRAPVEWWGRALAGLDGEGSGG